MSDPISKAKQRIPTLETFVDRLLILAKEILGQDHTIDDKNHFGSMSHYFASVQREHLKSVKILVNAGQHRDALLITRCMIEGMGLLLWSAQEPLKRPYDWRSFAFMEDYRLMEEEKKNGKKIDPDLEADIRQNYNIYSPNFLNNKGKKAKDKGLSLTGGHYYKYWYKSKNIRVIFEKEIKAEHHYKLYQHASQWIHGNPHGLDTAIKRDKDVFQYFSPSPEAAATALASGFQALFETLYLLNSHLELGFTDQLDKLKKQCINNFSTS